MSSIDDAAVDSERVRLLELEAKRGQELTDQLETIRRELDEYKLQNSELTAELTRAQARTAEVTVETLYFYQLESRLNDAEGLLRQDDETHVISLHSQKMAAEKAEIESFQWKERNQELLKTMDELRLSLHSAEGRCLCSYIF